MKPQKGRLFEAVNGVLLGLLALLMIFPFWNVLVTSLSSPHLVFEGQLLLWPKGWSTIAYDTVFKNQQFIQTFKNTIFVTVIGTALSMLLTTTLAYPLSKKSVHGSAVMLFIAFFTMLFSGGIIPSYLLVKELHMLNTLWALIVPSALSVFNLMIMVSFFRSVPAELEESAKMDGCNDIGVLARIIVPISLPVLATLTLFYAVSKWNIFFQAVMYNSAVDKMTLQVLLRQILVQMTNEAVDAAMSGDTPRIGVSVKMAMIVIATVPILLIYPFLQKYFAKGTMIGSIKG
ncbi:carbohydrate ABC transporter permease [Paenibacillus ehimensis]|uniref:carbohydrate ABC transporter permease n=1 Tax=Paenibacillus ehimensis TaxID=79264 RepID=UPI002DBD4623|nr:carbohydrate ABC transporter permease [Paenibacillus ehimensis]MEC0212013.1 carbohydrate ABC transporter permease [Paenibacillus ehimensis]